MRPSSQLKSVSEVHDALRAEVDPLAGLRRVLPALSELFGSRHAAIELLPLQGGSPQLLEILFPEEIQETVRNYPAFALESPHARVMRVGGFFPVLRICDCTSPVQFAQTPYFKAVFMPAGWQDQLGFALRLRNEALGVWFHRERYFDDEDAGLAEQLRRLVADHFGLEAMGTEDGRFRNAWRLPLNGSGDVTILPSGARILLGRYFPNFNEEPSRLPGRLRDWVRNLRVRACHVRGANMTRTLILDRPYGRLHIEWSPVQTGGLAEVLCLHEDKGRHDYTRLKALRLTDREIEVLFWVAQGKADGDIAIIIGAARKTVSKHLENILLKLKVHSRTAAAVRAVEWLSDQEAELGECW